MDGMTMNPMSPISRPPGPSAVTPGPQGGLEASAMIKVRQAVMLLADAVGILKTQLDGDLGKAVLSSLKNLAPHTPGVQEGLGQSEIASLLAGASPVRPAPPGMNTMMGTRTPAPNFVGGTPSMTAPAPMAGR